MNMVALSDHGRRGGKVTRHRAILSVVASRPIRTQDELVDALERRHLHATQATVSRDIRELGLVRVHDRDGGRYIPPSPASGQEGDQTYAAQLVRIFSDHVRTIEFVGTLGIIRTRPSSAPLVATALDTGDHEGIAGTVAGDDTVLVIARGAAAARRLHSQLVKLTGNHR
jgi:transcriptional regulator of arginine metabolism